MNYRDLVKKILHEDNVAGGTGGVFSGAAGTVDAGSTGGHVGNVDSYAPGDARNVIGSYNKKGKKKKKKDSIPLYRRNKIESIFLGNIKEGIDTDTTPLTCVMVIKNNQFVDITRTYLEKVQVSFTESTENNCFVFSFKGTDDSITNITDKIPKIIGERAFDSGEFMVLIGEMSE